MLKQYFGHETFVQTARRFDEVIPHADAAAHLYGAEAHHAAEGLFKGFAHALRMAVEPDPRETGIPSSKGTL